MPTYLQKRRLRYYAVLEIPTALRSRFDGKPRFVKSLETDSRTVAMRRVGPIVFEWQAAIDRARGSAGPGDDAAFFRRALREAGPDGREDVMAAVREHSGVLWSAFRDEDAAALAQDVKRIETAEHVEEWLASTRTTAGVKDTRRTDVLRFAAKFPNLDQVTRPALNRWAIELLSDGLAIGTVTRTLSALRGYWKYLQSVGTVADDRNPFDRMDIGRQARREGGREKRRPFAPGDVVALREAARAGGDDALADLIEMAMWTGCRIEELCSLKVADVGADRFNVREAKTDAGIRVVPIHGALAPVVARLVQGSRDGYVISGERIDKYGRRQNRLGKRFAALRTATGCGADVTFHSIRKCVVTMLERAGVPEGTAQDVIGHGRSSLIGRTYSGKSTFEMKAAAIEKLTYPEPE